MNSGDDLNVFRSHFGESQPFPVALEMPDCRRSGPDDACNAFHMHVCKCVLERDPEDLYVHAGCTLHVGVALLLQRARLHLPETAHTAWRTVYLCCFGAPRALDQTRSIPDRSFQHVCYRSPAPESSTPWRFAEARGVVVQKRRKPPQLPSFIWGFAVAPNTSTHFSITAPFHYLRMESSFKKENYAS